MPECPKVRTLEEDQMTTHSSYDDGRDVAAEAHVRSGGGAGGYRALRCALRLPNGDARFPNADGPVRTLLTVFTLPERAFTPTFTPECTPAFTPAFTPVWPGRRWTTWRRDRRREIARDA
jgi:hypothetical protein